MSGKPKPEFSWEELDEIMGPRILSSIPPPGAFSAADLARHRGCGLSNARGLVRELCAEGKLEMVGIVTSRLGGRVKYYRTKEKTK